MGWPRHHAPEDLARALSGLPEPYSTTPIGGAHLVLGPSGAHVVALDTGDDEIPRAAARLASVVRSALAEHVPLAPYVDALLVTEREEPCPPATGTPPALLLRTLVDGPATIPPSTLDRLRGAIADGALDGLRSVAPDVAERTGPPLTSLR